MTLLCPVCDSPELHIIDSVELGPSAFWDESTMQRARCDGCGQRFLCSYLEKRSFRMDRDDTVSHSAYTADTPLWHLVGFAFRKSQRRVSKRWRAKIAMMALARYNKEASAMTIRYRSVSAQRSAHDKPA
ncbi:MAG: hypothetical protein AAF441_23600 [Pseudomonadota bacterium]